jgi:hypothetical protein
VGTIYTSSLLIFITSSRRHILDALPMLGSNAAIAVMKDIILRNGVSQDVAHEWLLTLSFITRYLLKSSNEEEPS